MLSRDAWPGDSLDTFNLPRTCTLDSSAETSLIIRASWAISCTRRSRSFDAACSESMRACSAGEGLPEQARALASASPATGRLRMIAFIPHVLSLPGPPDGRSSGAPLPLARRIQPEFVELRAGQYTRIPRQRPILKIAASIVWVTTPEQLRR